MKRFKVSTVLMSMAIALLGTTMQASAAEYDFTSPEVINGNIDVPYEVNRIYTDDEMAALKGTLPASYDARQHGQVSAVDDQNPYGTCWSFASMAALEGSMLSQGLYSSLDLSEYHMVNYNYKSVVDPLGGTAGDSVSYPYGMSSFLNAGGNVQIAYHSLTNWMGAVKDTGYVTDPNYVMPSTVESAYLNDIVHLQQFYVLHKDDVTAVKESIMEYGTVAISMYYDDYFMNSNGAYYNWYDDSSNHAVSIVGWDDNYSRNNFLDDPGVDGAWLVKNSWGTWWGLDGYFWMSYADTSFQEAVCVLVGEKADNYDHNYQYDGSYWNAWFTSTPANASVANIFQVPTTAKKEMLEAVSFEVNNTNTSYTIQIYKNPSSSNPASGTALLSTPQTGSVKYAGFHTIKLNQDVMLNPGDTFSVVIDLYSAYGVQPLFEYTTTWSGHGAKFVASADAGESFYKAGSSWTDTGRQYDMNVRVKAFTSDVDVKLVESITVSPSSASMYVGRSQKLTATVAPADANNKAIKWASSNTAVATVDQKGNVKAVGAGTAVITATAQDGSGVSGSCTITSTIEAGNPFYDVPSDQWYYPFSLRAYNEGIMSGVGTDAATGLVKFAPENSIPREQFVQILYNREGKPAVEYSPVFSDVPEQSGTAWYSDAIMWASQNDLVSGYNNGKFGVGDLITREQVAVILKKYAAYKGYDTTYTTSVNDLKASFNDVDKIHDWAQEAMCWAVERGVMSGKSGGWLDPLGNAQRAQAATMILNMVDAYEK